RGFEVFGAAGGSEMRRVLAEVEIDLVLLDLGLPGEDGIALTHELRASSSAAIIIVTAFGENEDRVLGLESGADDYVVKPFGLRELVARVRSVLRRTNANVDISSDEKVSNSIVLGENTYDLATRRFSRADDITIDLTSGECDLLELFVDNPDRAISRDELLQHTAHRGWEHFDRSIDVRINRLRRKIEVDPSHPQIIRTVRGVGYLYKSG
ncbi:MAG: response regulator transcription factor, partial [Rhodospirillaceae bacterium]|nr:response regulator transcription factor [Rhodospirillaceae bacterium]